MNAQASNLNTELNPSPSVPMRLNQWQIVLHRIKMWQQDLINRLTQSDDPKITQKIHHNGNMLWTIYDPRLDRRMTCHSEAEVRFWLEERYKAF